MRGEGSSARGEQRARGAARAGSSARGEQRVSMVFPLTRRMSRIKFPIRDRLHEIEFADGGKPIFIIFLWLFYAIVTKTQEGFLRHSEAEVRRLRTRLGPCRRRRAHATAWSASLTWTAST